MSWPFSRRSVTETPGARSMSAKAGCRASDGRFHGRPVDRVVRDQVHVGVQVERDVAQPARLLGRVVHALDQDELERHHAAVPLGEGATAGRSFARG